MKPLRAGARDVGGEALRRAARAGTAPIRGMVMVPPALIA